MSRRLALAAFIWLAILGGTTLFMRLEAPPATATVQQAAQLAGTFTLELTTTFELAPDPFALTADKSGDGALTVSQNGQTVFSAEELPAHNPMIIESLPPLLEGLNEFLVNASPPQEAGESYAVRLRLLRGDVPLAGETFWASGGAQVTGILQVDLEPQGTGHDG